MDENKMIKAFYKDLKMQESEEVPSFDSVWSSVKRKKHSRQKYKLLKYAAMVIFAAGISWMLIPAENANVADEAGEMPEIEWVYPTDQLLAYSEEVFAYEFTSEYNTNVNTENNEVQNEDENNNP